MSPVFAHGQLRLYLLALLEEGPRHGYDVIQDLEHRFDGLYSPSAGTVYPRLAKLEEEGLVERTDDGRKATYRITDAGRAEVAGRRAQIDNLQRDLDTSVRRLADEVATKVRGSAADLRAELQAAARAARASAAPAGSGPDAAHAEAADSADTRCGERDRGKHRGDYSDLDAAVSQLRAQARTAWRRHGLTTDQTREIADIVAEASRRIGDIIAHPHGTSGPDSRP